MDYGFCYVNGECKFHVIWIAVLGFILCWTLLATFEIKFQAKQFCVFESSGISWLWCLFLLHFSICREMKSFQKTKMTIPSSQCFYFSFTFLTISTIQAESEDDDSKMMMISNQIIPSSVIHQLLNSFKCCSSFNFSKTIVTLPHNIICPRLVSFFLFTLCPLNS